MKKCILDEMANKAGIYQIKNKVDGKVYIGSTKCFKLRYNDHLCNLRNDKHPCRHLNRAYQLHGADNFEFAVVEVINRNEAETLPDFATRLCLIENGHIQRLSSNKMKYGYNKRITAASNLGLIYPADSGIRKPRGKCRVVSESEKRAISDRMKGANHPTTSLTEEQVRQVKFMIYKGWRQCNVAHHMGLSLDIVNNLHARTSWSWVELTDADKTNRRLPDNVDTFKFSLLNPCDIKRIKYLLSLGFRNMAISRFIGYSARKISEIKNGDKYPSVVLNQGEGDEFYTPAQIQQLRQIDSAMDAEISQKISQSKKGKPRSQPQKPAPNSLLHVFS